MLHWNELLLDPFGGEGQGDGRPLKQISDDGRNRSSGEQNSEVESVAQVDKATAESRR